MRLQLLIITVLLLTGCGITGKAVDDYTKTEQLNEIDHLNIAVKELNLIKCYYIQTQYIREVCFITLAKELQDPNICDNLLGDSIKEACRLSAKDLNKTS